MYNGYDWYGRALEVREVRTDINATLQQEQANLTLSGHLYRIATPDYLGQALSVAASVVDRVAASGEASAEASEAVSGEDSLEGLAALRVVVHSIKICTQTILDPTKLLLLETRLPSGLAEERTQLAGLAAQQHQQPQVSTQNRVNKL